MVEKYLFNTDEKGYNHCIDDLENNQFCIAPEECSGLFKECIENEVCWLVILIIAPMSIINY